ncbi:hypothetical protein BHE74_00016270, partial [Ensete ventricosum]
IFSIPSVKSKRTLDMLPLHRPNLGPMPKLDPGSMSALSWYLEFAYILHLLGPFSRPMLSLHKSKGSMTLRKSCLYSTMVLPSLGHYYLLPRICVPFFVIGRSASMPL